MKPKLIQFSDDHAALIEAAAEKLGMTTTAFIRAAAIRQARKSDAN